MTAVDAASGKVLWQTGYKATFTMQSAAAKHGPGPKSTPVFANGKLYTIGMTGAVTAFDAATGKQLWQKPGSDVVPFYTSHAFSPIVDRGLVIYLWTHVDSVERRTGHRRHRDEAQRSVGHR